MAFEIGLIFLLLLLNAFFALAEMAVVSASKPLLRQQAKRGTRRAQTALSLAEDSGKFLSTVQVGITLVGILAGAFGGAQIADRLGPLLNEIPWLSPHGPTIALVIVVSAITYFSVVIGELIPKQLALSNPERIAMLVAPPMAIISWLASPLVAALEVSGNLVFRLFGFKQQSEAVTEAELKATLAEGAASGAIEPVEHDMLQRIIRLGDRDVKAIMTHRFDVVFIDVNDSLDAIKQKIHEAGHSRYPVIDRDVTNILGVINAYELLDDALQGAGPLNIQQRIRDVTFLPESTMCLDALELFKTSKVHMAVIVDEYGSAEGIVTASDILEAIVGVLPTNYDVNEDALVVKRADGSLLVDGMIPMDELWMQLGIDDAAPVTGYTTLAGFLVKELGATPRPGDTIEALGFRFEVIDLDFRRIDKVLVTQLAKD